MVSITWLTFCRDFGQGPPFCPTLQLVVSSFPGSRDFSGLHFGLEVHFVCPYSTAEPYTVFQEMTMLLYIWSIWCRLDQRNTHLGIVVGKNSNSCRTVHAMFLFPGLLVSVRLLILITIIILWSVLRPWLFLSMNWLLWFGWYCIPGWIWLIACLTSASWICIFSLISHRFFIDFHHLFTFVWFTFVFH
jgi:hypothetical protein